MSKKLLTYEEAKRAIEATFKPVSLGMEEAVLLEAYNRVLAWILWRVGYSGV